MPRLTRSFSKRIKIYGLRVWKSKSYWLRIFLCLAVGIVILSNDENSQLDLRLRARGFRPAKTNIVLIDISDRDFASLTRDSRNMLRPFQDILNFSDSLFWNEQLWGQVLKLVLENQPTALGITFFFGDHLRLEDETLRSYFEDSRVIWSADVDSSGRVLVPFFASNYNTNVGFTRLRSDDDGIVRHFSTSLSSLLQIPHLVTRLVELSDPSLGEYIKQNYLSPALINYAGPASSFRVIKAKDLLAKTQDLTVLKNAIVLVGSLSRPMEQLQTPLGKMSRLEVMANVTENILQKSTPIRYSDWIYVLMLSFLMLISLWFLASYPQSVALVAILVTGTLWSSISLWAFDELYVWIPIFSAVAQLSITYIVFLSYQLALNEQKTWQLEQEQKYLSEIEQLKANFVSMMSHDLKTPIAKIQAICDRLISFSTESELSTDLKSLRKSSDELHRYIQSILQVTKVEARDFRLSKEVIDINEVIERVISILKPLANEKNIVIETELDPLFSIEADTTLIQEVIHNLVENAVKYSPHESRIRVISSEIDDDVCVTIIDQGPGIALEDQKDVWKKFSRGKQAHSHVKGTGLGLYLVKYFIELHGGQVFLESSPLKGTKIGFKIPFAMDSEASA